MIQDLLTLVPLVITIYLAVKTKDVIIAIYTGIASGILILTGGHIFKAIYSFFGDYLIIQITDSYNAGVIVLLAFIGGFIALIEYAEGANAFAEKITRFLNTKVKTQLAAFFFGALIFFSDLGTPLIVGPVFSPLFDKMKICRAKLAYIIDSTASPMAIMIPFTGWGVYILSLIDAQVANGVYDGNSVEIFMSALGYQFYSILTLVIVPIVIIGKLDILSMNKSQLVDEQKSVAKATHSDGQAKSIIIPLLVLFTVLIGGLIAVDFPRTQLVGSTFRIILASAYFLASVSLILVVWLSKKDTLQNLYKTFIGGITKSSYLVIILLGAWSLSSVIDNLGTADVITGVLDAHVPQFLYPTLIFFAGAVLSASTGSSWGTFAILTPFAFGMTEISNIDPSLLMGAVLSGGLFGDHLSPISDTTILSSTGANVNLIEHVKTQLPYGVINAISSIICFIGAAIYSSYLWLLVGLTISVVSIVVIKKYETSNQKMEALHE
ncbi:SLC13 family permease [Mollicutes bacterium LVI A0039]|nr:SLC13 family permease [Mollicutes bacterium LVI A0039]